MVDYIQELKSFFYDHEFFYTQYKHGLTIAPRPFAKYTAEQITENMKHPTDAYLAVFDNLSVKKIKRGTSPFHGMIMMAHLTASMNGQINNLINEDNLIRYVTPKNKISIEVLKKLLLNAETASVQSAIT